MTVQTNTTVASGAGNGVTTTFPVGFKFNRPEDLVVTIVDDATEIETPITLYSDYTVAGAGHESGGSITLTGGALAPGKTLIAKRIIPLLQTTDLRNQGKFFAETHEEAFDRSTMIDQQQQEEIDRSMKVNLVGRWNALWRRIINVASPLNDGDASNKGYTDAGDLASRDYADQVDAASNAKSLRTPETVGTVPSAASRAGRLLSFDAQGNPIVVAAASQSATDLELALAAKLSKHILDYENHVIDRPDAANPAGWDWTPAFQAAADDKVTLLIPDKFAGRITSTVVYPNGNFDARFPVCLGRATLDASSMGGGGAGFNTELEVDDPAQPAWVSVLEVQNGSGFLNLTSAFDGIRIDGNNNTAALVIKGACGLRPDRMMFGPNRFGVVFSNDVAPGTFSEANVLYNPRFFNTCLVPAYYYKGVGDRSFHGSGIDEAWVDSTSSKPVVLVSDGALPYNAPIMMQVFKSSVGNATDRPVFLLRGTSSPGVAFFGTIRTEGETPELAGGDRDLYFVGNILGHGRQTYGRLVHCESFRSHGPAGGNLSVVAKLKPRNYRKDGIASTASTRICPFGYKAFVQVWGDNRFISFDVKCVRLNGGGTPQISPPEVGAVFGATIAELNLSVASDGLYIAPGWAYNVQVTLEASGLDLASASNSTHDYIGAP